MAYGNFNRNQALLEANGDYLLIGGPLDPDVKKVLEVCAWIVQGHDDGQDAAATEMADLSHPDRQAGHLLLFKEHDESAASAHSSEVPLLQVFHQGTPKNPSRLEWKLVERDTGGTGEFFLIKPSRSDIKTYIKVDPTMPDPDEWLLVVERKGEKKFAPQHPAVALAIAKAVTQDDNERVESWAQTVMVVAAKDAQNQHLERLIGLHSRN